jgi:UDP-2-acetamido-2,6-beta-L-arabino-hexul-4-ose reductase
MKRTVVVTGAGGFIGAHLRRRLERQADVALRIVDRADWSDPSALAEKLAGADVIFHLAGVNRAADEEIERTNVELASRLIAALASAGTTPRVVYASSTQESRENAYGRSKRMAGDRLLEWAARTRGEATVLVLPNVFGPGCRPFYNSVVATFCRQLATGETPRIDSDAEIEFLSVRDLVERMAAFVSAECDDSGRLRIEGQRRLRVSELLARLETIREAFVPGGVTPDLSDPFDRDLYLTYLSHCEPAGWTREPQVYVDPRGELYEVLKLAHGGQIFFSTTHPGVVRGNHWHSRKTEWFCVVRGEAVVRLKHVDGGQTVEIPVSGASPRFVAIPPFHVHHIENIGREDLLTLFWASEIFDPADADTFSDGSLCDANRSPGDRRAA